MLSAIAAAYERLKWVGDRLIAPFRRGEGPNKFRLSSPDTATTTYDGSVGWSNRPPATLECPRCESDIVQQRGYDRIDCPRCVAQFEYSEFGDLTVRYFTCPVCRSRMIHGQRHPDQFDIPEWATCNGCRYHWEFKHSY